MMERHPTGPRRTRPPVVGLAVILATAATGFLASWATGMDTPWSILQGLAFGAAATAATLGEGRLCRVTSRHDEQ